MANDCSWPAAAIVCRRQELTLAFAASWAECQLTSEIDVSASRPRAVRQNGVPVFDSERMPHERNDGSVL